MIQKFRGALRKEFPVPSRGALQRNISAGYTAGLRSAGRARRPSPHPISMPFVFQILLHFVCRHASGPSGGYGLAVTAVLHVAASEYAWHFRKDILMRDQVAIRIGFELAFEDLRVRDVADPKKHRAGREIPTLAALQIAQTQRRDFLLADIENVIHHGVGEKLDL